MQGIPLDVLRFLATNFLPDRDRLALAQTCRRCHRVAHLDAAPVILDTVLDVRGREGFARSNNGYWFSLPTPDDMDVDPDPQFLGIMAATDPWAFVQRWMALPLHVKTAQFRRACLDGLTLHTMTWDLAILASLKVMLQCPHPACAGLCSHLLCASTHQLLRRAVWYGRIDVLCALLDQGKIDADVGEGTPLRLALGTLGYEQTEDQVAKIVYELLKRGASPLRHNLWGIRLCLQRNFYVVAALLCLYAVKHSGGQPKLCALLQELYASGYVEQAYLVKASMEEAPDFFCFRV